MTTENHVRNLWNLVAETLADAGCDSVFGLPSDEPGLMDAAAGQPRLRVVGVRDQRVGACAAVGHAAVTGRPAVLAVNSGPSFANTLTGLLEASSLGAPLVVVTTRVPLAGIGRGGFQYTDQAAMAGPLAKWTFLVESPAQLTWALRRAVHLAVNGGPGVVLVEIADEVLRAPAPERLPAGPVPRLRGAADAGDVDRAARLLAGARLPVIVAGGGCKPSGAGPAVRRLAEALGSPVFTTAAGRGTLDEEHPLACGLVGLYTTPPADSLLAAADVVLVVGSRLEETARMGWDSLPGKKLIHIDVDPGVFLTALEPEVALLGDAATVAVQLTEALSGAPADPEAAARRRAEAAAVRAALHALYGASGADGAGDTPLTVPAALRLLQESVAREATLVQENGLHDMWGYHYPVVSVSDRAKVITPGEQTMVGFGLPAALGAALADPTRRTVLVCGDGAFEMSLAALPTAAEQRIGLTALVLDNGGYGWPRFVRADEGAPDTLTRFTAPSHAEAAVRAVGGWSARCATEGELAAALETAAKVTAEGRTAVITVPVRDEDVPVGVRGLFDGHGAAGSPAAEGPSAGEGHAAGAPDGVAA
ncbi:thiamine pyrophosphate-binding protein [Streptomyces antarcticus]|uniref:thiamine pyrophosphate-binding protein n=1 Tax=Streptomyces antarcticus TaxID=2996458 RepID=UPI00226E1F81|nr:MULTISPECIES: thiamine pyrophosphate-binding protein [unclassified Streptomyces]MCY0942954.1 thiamine pyrophosphate-binding protein [Streptomyces sp. H34-AA3]MCY0952999.1 thiamine pyrophosphate-binding protein [Streptomyces sp. H27-S2]MCZ4083086.1 thiamine pyrophosphate-binding protein [Streptomyces sp. H34-S5]